jgi:hypothetical protein
VQPQDLAQILAPPGDISTALPLAMAITVILAVIPAVVARMKGHNPVLWYLYGCVFFPGALLQVLFLSNLKRRQMGLGLQAGPSSQADELERWARLRDRGLLTQVEFEEKKRQLLQAAPAAPGRP